MVESDRNLPRLMQRRARATPEGAAYRIKVRGRWQTWVWRDVAEQVEALARGLAARGLGPGDRLAILAATRFEWILVDLAALHVGAVTVPIYPSSTSEQVAHVLGHSRASMVVVEDDAQLTKVLPHLQRLDDLREVVLMEESGERGVPALAAIFEAARLAGGGVQDRIRQQLDRLGPDDWATIVYTSGTAGDPKGVVQTHGNHLAMTRSLQSVSPVGPGDVELLYLPLAHAFGRCLEFHHLARGHEMAIAESLEALPANLREVRPTWMASVPRVFEKLQAAFRRSYDTPVKARLFRWAFELGHQVRRLEEARSRIPRRLRAAHDLADRLVFQALRRQLGGRLRFVIVGAAPLPAPLARWFDAAGVRLLEGYGLTETTPATHFNRPDRFKFGTVGLPLPGVEVRIEPDGEIAVRGPNVAVGYLDDPEATAGAFRPGGWFLTGDLGEIDDEGFLTLRGRKKEIIVTSGGKNVAPRRLEEALEACPLIRQAVVVGEGRPYLTALVTLDVEEARRCLGDRRVPESELAGHPRVLAEVTAWRERVNAGLAPFETIKDHRVLPRPFTEEEGFLTPTGKLVRPAIVAYHGELIERLYAADPRLEVAL